MRHRITLIVLAALSMWLLARHRDETGAAPLEENDADLLSANHELDVDNAVNVDSENYVSSPLLTAESTRCVYRRDGRSNEQCTNS